MPENYSILFIALFSIFSLATAIQLFYYLYFYLSVYKYKPTGLKVKSQAVSVIICAKNEAENLSRFLPFILEQDYPDYEVIVVNDCSEDNSSDILGDLQSKYPHLKVSTIIKDLKFSHTKKFAQFIGIKAAKNEILLFTDADCQPESDKWVKEMTSHFEDNISFVLGYGGYFREKGLLNKYICYDCMAIAMQYLGMAIRGIPYMGVGRNLAYRRSVFFAKNGYGAHNHLISGDDDLFVNTNSTAGNTSVEYSHGAHTRSIPCSNTRQFITQKRRHLTTAPYYKFRDRLLLITEPSARIIFYATLIVLLSYTFLWPYVIALFVVRLTVQISVLNHVQKKLSEPGLMPYSLFFDIFSPIINSIIYLSNFRRRAGKKVWK